MTMCNSKYWCYSSCFIGDVWQATIKHLFLSFLCYTYLQALSIDREVREHVCKQRWPHLQTVNSGFNIGRALFVVGSCSICATGRSHTMVPTLNFNTPFIFLFCIHSFVSVFLFILDGSPPDPWGHAAKLYSFYVCNSYNHGYQ